MLLKIIKNSAFWVEFFDNAPAPAYSCGKTDYISPLFRVQKSGLSPSL